MAAKFKAIDARTARVVLDSGARVIDIRSKAEWSAGHIEGSDRVDPSRVGANTIGRADAIIVVCRNGKKSRRTAKKLAKEGYRVYHLNDGLQAWYNLGLPLVSSDGARAKV